MGSPPSLVQLPSETPSSLPQQCSFSPPSSILIVGSGAFGLSTAWALARRDAFSQCSITILDRSDPSKPDVFLARDAASIDTSRIIRADYSDPAYAALAVEAQLEWRKQAEPTDLGAQGRYNESGLIVVADPVPDTALPAKTGMEYVRSSWMNVLELSTDNSPRIEELTNPEAIRDKLGTGGSSGSWGYYNAGSGWADAEGSMTWLVSQVQETGRVKFISGNVVSLQHSDIRVTGVQLSNGTIISGDLVIVAAGAWTGGLVDVFGQATATGQVLGYLELTEAEQEELGKMPVVLNLTSGVFIIPPRNRILKVARHAYGYLNPTTLSPLSSPNAATPGPVSYPLTQVSEPNLKIPQEGANDLRRALAEIVPLPGLAERRFMRTRLCWYSDTPTADFLIDYHPTWLGLFVATGDSGHAFKFLPVIGEKIVDCIMHNCPAEFLGKWNWKSAATSIVTQDGSRGGTAGLVLSDELRDAAEY